MLSPELSNQPEPIAVFLFLTIVGLVLVLSWYFAKKARSAAGYFAAGGSIHWMVNGVAFAGDYLSAASFLGICGMIAFYGYDGFLYSIGYLAGWIVAMFVVAEPMKRLGKYTFADALDAKFNSKGIQLAAAVSTLIVSMCYLIPQMVGAGTLVEPLLGLPHFVGVLIVGGVVIVIVSTAGMTSTTYVQFIKGGLLIVFSVVLVMLVLVKGFTAPDLATIDAAVDKGNITIADMSFTVTSSYNAENINRTFVVLEKNSEKTVWQLMEDEGKPIIREVPFQMTTAQGETFSRIFATGFVSKIVQDGKVVKETGSLDPLSYLRTFMGSIIAPPAKISYDADGSHYTVWFHNEQPGSQLLQPGASNKFKLDPDKGATPQSILNFISLMLALFFGTAALPHILIRYYTVPSPKDARKSTIVAIAGIGFFYILTLFMGLGAMSGGVINVLDSNSAAPLLAKSFNTVIFAIISAIAFATVLGTVSGLIVASSGAIAHDLADRYLGLKINDKTKVIIGKAAAVGVGLLAIVLGILFQGMNVSFLVGWAFSVAASANLPAILMLLFWKKTTKLGITVSIFVGIALSLAIILLSPDMYAVYGLNPDTALIQLSQPAIISVPMSFLTLIIVSLFTQKQKGTLEKV
ncbi:MAG: cation acetate symporter [Spirochaetales bacterium]|nr:cation acetate symporter [Spirochaetales bacterium]